jgi:protein involved in sex pheromone biosynthesis
MNSVEYYARKWTKQKKEVVDTLSEWAKAIMSLVQIRINIFKMSMSTKATSVLKDSDLTETMSTIHEKYVVFPADKTRNNIVL